jgi:hypothetical protein
MGPYLQSLDSYEHASLAMLNGEEQALNAKVFTIGTTPSPSSVQIQGFVNDLNAILSRLFGYGSTAADLASKGRPAYGQRLQALIGRVKSNVQTQEMAYRSRIAFETAMGVPANQPGYSPLPFPRPGGPEWFMATMGYRCYWCGFDLSGMPKPVGICPNCGRFPTAPAT